MSDYQKKYDTLIDVETWAFIEKTNSLHPPETSEFSIERQRKFYDAMCKEFFAGYPPGVEATDGVIEGRFPVPIRSYRKTGSFAKAQIVYLHGGGFVFGGLDSHDDVCAELCEHTGYELVSVDYRLAPENLFPSDFEDALTGFTYAAEKSDLPIIMVGDSAGANLAAAVCHHVRGAGRQPVGQVLIYPGLGGDMTKGSYVDHSDAPLLQSKDISFYTHIRTNGVIIENVRSYAPLQDSKFSGLPPTVVISADCDPMRDDGDEYCKQIINAGGKAHWINEAGLVHGYLRARHSVKRARDSFSRITGAVAALGIGEWPY